MATASSYRVDTRLVWDRLYCILHDACLAACEIGFAIFRLDIFRTFSHRQPIPTIQTIGFTNEMALLGYSKSW